jgi:uncharacterized protein YutE (UPF0331/DUF86 family)
MHDHLQQFQQYLKPFREYAKSQTKDQRGLFRQFCQLHILRIVDTCPHVAVRILVLWIQRPYTTWKNLAL